MGLIPDEIISEIRERTDIVAVVGEHVQLRKAGQNHKGLCPFHDEKTPSFNVNAGKQFFYCFGCQKKGDVFTFVMEYEGKSFAEAARSLAERAGIVIPETEEPEAARRQRSERARLLEINKLACAFFRTTLLDERAGATGRAYLAERGIGAEVSEHFALGYAPAEWRALADHLVEKGVDLTAAARVGLVVPQPRAGGFYDRFRERLVCPVVLPGGEIAGFSGRLLSADSKERAKYINSPESAVYKKSKLLYGLHRARDAFRRTGRAILVEGNFDVISLHQAGFEETVAPLGTALTAEQVGFMRRLTDCVVVAYDGDKAGRAATLKALKTLASADVEVRIADIPADQDPDSLLHEVGAEAVRAIFDRAQPGVEYFAFEVWSKASASSDGRARALEEAADVVRSVRNPTKRDLIVGTLATAMGIDAAVVRRAISTAARSAAPPPSRPEDAQLSPAETARSADPPPREELEIIAILADHPQLMELAEENNVFSLLTDGLLRDMYCAARRGASPLAALPDALSPSIAKHVLAGSYASVKDPAHCLLEAVAGLKRARKRTQLADLQRKAAVAKRRGDVDLERTLVREILTLRRQVD